MLPDTIGVGLKPQHYKTIIDDQPTSVGWFEVHPENYMGDGGLPHYYLEKISHCYPLSMHGVGLSLGSTDGIDSNHLNNLAKVVQRYQPAQVSEHLAWSHWQQTFFNDLLPVPYTDDFLKCVVSNIHHVQDVLQRTILIENPSVYLDITDNTYQETDFLRELVKQTGCGLLLDINNVYVSTNNLHTSTIDYIDHYPLEAIGEIHLAGHSQESVENEMILIDDHGSEIIDAVWDLFRYTLNKLQKPTPTLIEWDTNIPQWQTLAKEADKANAIINKISLKRAG